MHITINQKSQRGIGMVEVLVALLLLAVGVLGFSALQSYAVYSTTESLNRTQALTVMRGLAERVRANSTSGNGVKKTTLDSYKAAMGLGEPSVPSKLCRSNGGATVPAGCTQAEIAVVDVYDARTAAWDSGIQLGMTTCPGTVDVGERQCLVAAWDKTTPTITADANACMKEDGSYRPEANCIVMEIY